MLEHILSLIRISRVPNNTHESFTKAQGKLL